MGTAFITINENELREPLEIFINVGKAGTDVAAMAEALGRTISATLRFRGDLGAKERAEEIARQLAGIGGRRTVGFGPKRIRSLPDAIAIALSNHYGFKINGNGSKIANGNHFGTQPDLAGAVMVASSPEPNGDGETRFAGESDPTTASAESDLVSMNETVDEPELLEPQQLMMTIAGDICPSCGSGALVYEEGCSKCYVCGHSEC